MPQVYDAGLLAGANDHAAVAAAGEGRAVNRHDYTAGEIDAALERPVVQRLLELVRLRATHPAFAGPLTVEVPSPGVLVMQRGGEGARLTLRVDLREGTFRVA